MHREMERHVLLHAHMFKNAGTSLDASLRQSFGAAFVDHRDDESMRLGAQYLGPYIENHAEMLALRDAAAAVGSSRLDGATLVSTLEPCPMCAGAIVHARIERVVFAAWDPRTGAAGSVFDLLRCADLNHRAEVTGGVLETLSAEQLRGFFAARRRSANA